MAGKQMRRNGTRISEEQLNALFSSLDKENTQEVSVQQIIEILEAGGISRKDPRIKEHLKNSQQKLGKSEMMKLFKARGGEVIFRALKKDLVIPQFQRFKKEIERIFEETRGVEKGEMNDTIPHPAPERQPAYAVSICTVDGQLLQLGDHDLAFLLQSICKPVNYAIALEEAGKEKVHAHVGVEPGSESFDEGMILNEKDLPHNPLITSGSIMTTSFIKPDLQVDDRLRNVMDVWEKLTGGKKVNYNKDSFEAERKDANKHYALAHLMKERGAFPNDVDLEPLIDFYLKCCAIEVNIDDLAHAAATLANYGKCPSTGKEVFQHDTVRDTLSLMLSSGTYDHSGEFAFRVGLPAKSGIAGGIMVMVPGLMGIAIYSPPLDPHMNSVRGIAFCEKLADTYNIHNLDAVGTNIHGKKDPRV